MTAQGSGNFNLKKGDDCVAIFLLVFFISNSLIEYSHSILSAPLKQIVEQEH